MKTLLIILFIASCIGVASAQDVIYTSDGKQIKATVLEENTKEIKYKDATGAEITMPVKDILKIKFKDGKEKKYSVEKSKKQFILLPHVITWDVLGLLYQKNLVVGYEYINKKQSLGIKIPFSMSLTENYYDFGLDARFYLRSRDTSYYRLGNIALGFGQFRYFLGPGLMYAIADNNMAALKLTGGVTMQFMKGISFGVFGWVGPGMILGQNKYYTEYNISFVVGYRFKKKK